MIPSAGIFVLAVLIIKLSPNLVFEPAILEWVCLAYALIISLMVGKAVSVFAKERNRFTVLLFVGVLLFVISDVALIFNMFADGGRITRILCLFTYYPANCILAHSMFQSVELQVAAKRK